MSISLNNVNSEVVRAHQRIDALGGSSSADKGVVTAIKVKDYDTNRYPYDSWIEIPYPYGYSAYTHFVIINVLNNYANVQFFCQPDYSRDNFSITTNNQVKTTLSVSFVFIKFASSDYSH